MAEFDDSAVAPVFHDPFADMGEKLGEMNRNAFGPLAGPTQNLLPESGVPLLGGVAPGRMPSLQPQPITGDPYAAKAAPEEAPPTVAKPVPEEAPPAPAPAPVEGPLLKQDNPFGDHNPVGTHPAEEALTVNQILHPDTPAPFGPRSRGVEDIAGELDARAQQTLKDLGVKSGRIQGPDPVTDELLARSLASETSAALGRPGANASDWYTGKIKEAMDVASVMHPEIATDPGAKDAFRAALAITSQGEMVPRNADLAERAFQVFKETGRFPEDVAAKQGPSMNNNFKKLNALIDSQGWEETRKFLDEPTRVRDLKDKGFDVGSSESMDTNVYGSHILGAKIGNGFYQNLGGNYDPTTFDLWWMRGWNRKTGNLTGLQDISGQQSRLANALTGEGQKVPKSADALDKIAQANVTQHERDFTNFRPEYDSGARTKSELTYASERWLKARYGVNEAPTSGGQRTWMRSVVDRARDILLQGGKPMTNADLQATLWYPEKDLYGKLGGRPSDAVNVDYATAFRNVAKKRGFTDEQLSAGAGLLPASRRSGPAPSADVGPGNQGGGAPSGGGPPPQAGAAPGPGQAGLETPALGDPFAVGGT